MVLPLDQTTRNYLENEGKTLAIHYVFGELAGRAVMWIKPGINAANLGLFAVTTYLAQSIIARLTKRAPSPDKRDWLNHVLSLGVSYGVLKYIGYSVSPVGVLALEVIAAAASYLAQPVKQKIEMASGFR